MKSIFQLIVSVVVGTLLGISVYNKLLINNQIKQATDIDVDLSLLTDDTDFSYKQMQADSLAYVKYQDSLQRTIILIESESARQDTASIISQSAQVELPQKKPVLQAKKRVGIQPKIELSDLKKPVAPALPIAEFQKPEKTEIASNTNNTSASELDMADINGASQTQQQAEKKKKFLFFNKKSKPN